MSANGNGGNLKLIGASVNFGIPSSSGSEIAPRVIAEKLGLQFYSILEVENGIDSNLVSHETNSYNVNPKIYSYLNKLYHAVYKELVEKEFNKQFSTPHNTTPDLITVIGGDHSIAIATWQAALKLYDEGKFALIWIDAHLDGHNFSTTSSGNIHGMPVATLLGRCKELEFIEEFSYLKPSEIYMVGIRDYEPEELEFLQKLGVTIYFMEEVKKRSFKVVMDEIITKIERQGQHFGISLDLDYFTPTVVKGVNTQAEGGGEVEEVVEYFANGLNKKKLELFELVEFNPNKDDGNTISCISDVLNAFNN